MGTPPTPKYLARLNGLDFTVSHLALEPTDRMIGHRRVYRLERDFGVTLRFNGGYMELVAPRGFETDLASLPLIVELFIGRRDSPGLAECSILHDLSCERKLPRGIATAFMLATMVCFGVRPWKRAGIICALTLFGYQTRALRIVGKIKNLWQWFMGWKFDD